MSEAFAIPEPYEWDSSFDVKIGSLNEQHKNLFRLIDNLAKDQSNAAILAELLGAVKAHFETEEVRATRPCFAYSAALRHVVDLRMATTCSPFLTVPFMAFPSDRPQSLFAEFGYTHADSHKGIHDKFLADCAAVTAINDDVIAFLKNWLVVHIKGSDMKYAEPMVAAGAQ